MYEPPQSNLDIDSAESSYQTLLQQQRPILGALATAVVTIFSVVVLVMIGGVVIALIFLLPSILAGLTAKFVGRPVQEVHRIVPSIIVAFLLVLVFMQAGLVLQVVVPLTSFGICYAIARRKLSYDEEKILYRIKLKRKNNSA